MYKILGADQQEYGPVAVETVLQWIREGRLNANTRARLADTPDWKRLCEFPEFAAVFPAAAPPPARPASPPITDADAMARQILARGYHLEAGHCISRGWQLVKQNFWLTVGATFVANLILGVPYVGWLFTGVMSGGLYFLFLKLVRGQRAEFGDAFAGFSQGVRAIAPGGRGAIPSHRVGFSLLHPAGNLSGRGLVAGRAAGHGQKTRILAGHGIEPEGDFRPLVAVLWPVPALYFGVPAGGAGLLHWNSRGNARRPRRRGLRL
jgi:hypothetical protein